MISLICQKLNNFTRAPDYIAYLAYILSAMPQEDDRIRTIAGYLLKNNARLILRAAPDVTAFVKSAVLTAFGDPSIMIRNAAAQDIVAFLGILEPKNWPECLQQLVHMLEAANLDQQEVRAFRMINCRIASLVCTRLVVLSTRRRRCPYACRPIGRGVRHSTLAATLVATQTSYYSPARRLSCIV